jgi:hypothetical protein
MGFELKGFFIILIAAALSICLGVVCLSRSRGHAERIHGIAFPKSTARIVNVSKGGFLASKGLIPDGGFLTFFDIAEGDLVTFTQQLQVQIRVTPAREGACDPTDIRVSAWPRVGRRIPGNMHRPDNRWRGECIPFEAYTCRSKTGDFLVVELWRWNRRILIKAYTNWN